MKCHILRFEASEISENVMKYDELFAFIQEQISSSDSSIDERLLAHISKCCEGLTLSNNRKREDWVQCLAPYLSTNNNNDYMLLLHYLSPL